MSAKQEFLQSCEEGNLPKLKEICSSGDITSLWETKGKSSGLHLAASEGHLDVVRYLLTFHIDVNVIDRTGQTPLWAACQSGNEEIIKVLLQDPRVDVNHEDKKGATPFSIACAQELKEILKIFLRDPRFNVNKEDNFGQTPLWIACKNSTFEIAEMLLRDERVDVNRENRYGQTPLWIACSNGNLKLVKLLFASGIRVDIKKRTNSSFLLNPHITAAEIAAEMGMDKIAALVGAYEGSQKEVCSRLRKERGI